VATRVFAFAGLSFSGDLAFVQHLPPNQSARRMGACPTPALPGFAHHRKGFAAAIIKHWRAWPGFLLRQHLLESWQVLPRSWSSL